MSKVFANGRSILHKGDGHTHVSAAPDVCKVPTPGGPVPTPFVNSAQDSMLGKGSKHVTIEGHPVALTSSELSTSNGDEPGTAGGLISSKFQGKMTWGGGSVDVKVEGKGVARFLDPTLHNGNTFNTAFLAAGGTGLAYGDDTQCMACGKSVERHRVLETPEVVALVEAVFMELMKRFQDQRPLTDYYFELRKKRDELQKRSLDEVKRADEHLAPQNQRLSELRDRIRSASEVDKPALRAEIIPLQDAIQSARQAAIHKRKNDVKILEALQEEINTTNNTLKQMQPVLRWHDEEKTYVEGYMLGICVCKCSQNSLVACSGDIAPGFREVVRATNFELVPGFQMTARQSEAVTRRNRNWSCAAPKLLQRGRAEGHRVRAMSERYFSPFLGHKVMVTYSYTDSEGTDPQKQGEFGHGESVPSCDTCQELIPEMLCDNQQECP